MSATLRTVRTIVRADSAIHARVHGIDYAMIPAGSGAYAVIDNAHTAYPTIGAARLAIAAHMMARTSR
jgi:hypothetical protein